MACKTKGKGKGGRKGKWEENSKWKFHSAPG